MKMTDDPIWLKTFSETQQKLADAKQSEAAEHQRAAAAARRRIKQLRREGKADGKES
jgi:hypothetical protein